MTTFIRGISWSMLLVSLLLMSAAAWAQLATPLEPNPALAMYTSNEHLDLGWAATAADTTATSPDSLAMARPALLDLRIGRPTTYAVGVVLYWTSTNEHPATQFVVERRDEGQPGYHPVAVLPGQGAGQELHSYSFVDDGNANTAPTHYRLRQVCVGECLSRVSAVQVVPGATVAPPEPKDDPSVPGPSLALD